MPHCFARGYVVRRCLCSEDGSGVWSGSGEIESGSGSLLESIAGSGSQELLNLMPGVIGDAGHVRS